MAETTTLHRSTTKRTGTINIRVSSSQRDLIDQAAAAQGKSRSDFMLEAAHHAAVNALLNQTFFQLNEKDHKRFVAMLDSPPKANAKLRKLMQGKSPW